MSEQCNGNCSSCGSSSSCAQSKEKVPTKFDKIPHKIFVLSGKGGVGKSTVAAALAIALAREGLKVALLDVDFHGPSQPTLFGAAGKHLVGTEDGGVEPMNVFGIQLVSIGFLLENPDDAVILRGPAKIGLMNQLFEEISWGDDLDVAILDFPPGTGDEALSAAQAIQGDKSALVVTTPQEVSLSDCRKCIDFCKKLNLNVMGIVENMSGFVCPNCKTRHALFSTGGGEKLAAQSGVELMASIPLDHEFLLACDRGEIAKGLLASFAVYPEFTKLASKIIEKQIDKT